MTSPTHDKELTKQQKQYVCVNDIAYHLEQNYYDESDGGVKLTAQECKEFGQFLDDEAIELDQLRRDAVEDLKIEYVKSHGWYQDKDNPFNPNAWFNNNSSIGEENIDDVIELIRAKTLGEQVKKDA